MVNRQISGLVIKACQQIQISRGKNVGQLMFSPMNVTTILYYSLIEFLCEICMVTQGRNINKNKL